MTETHRVAIICDVAAWAFDGIAQGIKKHNPYPQLEIDVLYERDLSLTGPVDTKRTLDQYDILYPFSLFQAYFLMRHGYQNYVTVVHMGPLGHDQFMGHTLPSLEAYNPKLLAAGLNAQRLMVLSPVLEAIWGQRRGDVKRVHVGLDPDKFHPQPQEETQRIRLDAAEPLRVGWVGNPTKEMKRYHLIEEATNQAQGVALCTVPWVDVAGKYVVPTIPHDEMKRFFWGLDVYLCLSAHEGLPTPGIEAASCGIPIISTPVGVMSELVWNRQTGWIINPVEDPVAGAVRCLEWMVGHPEATREMGEAMATQMQEYIWPKVVAEWLDPVLGVI